MIKQVLVNMLQVLETQLTLITQLAGDVAALKTVLCSLDAQTAKQFDKEVGLLHRRISELYAAQRQSLDTLKQLVSKLPNQKQN